MTQVRNNLNAIENHFDTLFQGIGKRGSSFADYDSLQSTRKWVTHDRDGPRFLIMEFKHELEKLKGNIEEVLTDSARQPRTTVWLLRKMDKPKNYKIRWWPDAIERPISAEGLRFVYARWWGQELDMQTSLI